MAWAWSWGVRVYHGGSGSAMGSRPKKFFFLKWPGHSPGGSKSQNFFSLTRNHYQTPTLFLNWLTARKKFIFFRVFKSKLLPPLISHWTITPAHFDFTESDFDQKTQGFWLTFFQSQNQRCFTRILINFFGTQFFSSRETITIGILHVNWTILVFEDIVDGVSLGFWKRSF